MPGGLVWSVTVFGLVSFESCEIDKHICTRPYQFAAGPVDSDSISLIVVQQLSSLSLAPLCKRKPCGYFGTFG